MEKHFVVGGAARRIEEIDAYLYSHSKRTDYAFDGDGRNSVKALITVTADSVARLDYLVQYQRDRFASGLFFTVTYPTLSEAKKVIAQHLVH